MKSALLALLLLWQVAAPASHSPADVQRYSRYRRTVELSSGGGQACAVIDPQIFPHASPSLKDLRLYQGGRELPYAITLSEPEQPDGDVARVLNLGMHGRSIVFDLQMPNRPYTDVDLDLVGQNFVATATVIGGDTPRFSNATHHATQLGEFTLFDLTAQHLSRSATLHLQESTFPYLHVVLTPLPALPASHFIAKPEMVKGAAVPPSREAQSLYTVAAESRSIVQQGRQTVAIFALPERIPIERVTFVLAPEFKVNFSRDVHVSDHPAGTPQSAAETIVGTIFRVHLTEAAREIRQQQLSMPATLGANMQGPASVKVAVDNGDDAPLPVSAVRLEMRQRKLCFNAPATQAVTLFYGDEALAAPQYDYPRFFIAAAHTGAAQLGPEQLNPTYRSRPDTRPLTERYPDILWIALLAVICILAIIAMRSSRSVHR